MTTDLVQEIKREITMNNERFVNPSGYIDDQLLQEDKPMVAAHESVNMAMRVSLLEARVNRLLKELLYLQRSLTVSPIIKATPQMNLIFSDREKCAKRIRYVYRSWINLFSYVSIFTKSHEMTFRDIFNAIDKNIFGDFFKLSGKTLCIYPIYKTRLNDHIMDGEDRKVVDDILVRDRHLETLQLKNIPSKDYVSTHLIGDKLYLIYQWEEFLALCQEHKITTKGDTERLFGSKPLHPHLSTKHNIVGSPGNQMYVGVQGQGGEDLISLDRRHHVMGANKPYYNTTVNVSLVNQLNESLYGAGDTILNAIILIFHAMLHLRLENGDQHDEPFLNMMINYTPSVLFGHWLLPPITLENK